MYLIQLKMPPERVEVLIDSLQRDITTSAPQDQLTELTEILVWLRYRLQRWNSNRPATPVA